LQFAGGQAELGADGRQRDAHHRDVDAFQEDRAAEDEQNGQGAAAQPLRGDG
jgi:hypothetical protein